MMTVETTVPSPARMGLELIAVDQGAPLELDLRLEVGVRGGAGHRNGVGADIGRVFSVPAADHG